MIESDVVHPGAPVEGIKIVVNSLYLSLGFLIKRIEHLSGPDAAAEARAEQTEQWRQSLAGLTQPSTSTPPAPPAPLPPEPPEPVAYARDLDELRSQLAGLAARLDALDARITAISTELAHQLTELGNETGTASEAAAAVREAQVALANEQARYQIAFRAYLAEHAHQLRRNGTCPTLNVTQYHCLGR